MRPSELPDCQELSHWAREGWPDPIEEYGHQDGHRGGPDEVQEEREKTVEEQRLV